MLNKSLEKGCKSILTALLLKVLILMYRYAKNIALYIFIILFSVACLTDELNMGIAHKWIGIIGILENNENSKSYCAGVAGFAR